MQLQTDISTKPSRATTSRRRQKSVPYFGKKHPRPRCDEERQALLKCAAARDARHVRVAPPEDWELGAAHFSEPDPDADDDAEPESDDRVNDIQSEEAL